MNRSFPARAARHALVLGVAALTVSAPSALGSHSPGITERVSVDSDGNQANGISGRRSQPTLSADGRFVAFDSLASNLVAQDANPALDDIFLHDRLTGETELVSVATNGTQGQGISVAPSVSADGRFVAFESDAANLVANDTNERRDVFVRDRAAGTTERVSVATGGTQGDQTSFGASISADGRFVAFASDASNLVPDKTTIFRDVYVHDRMTHTTERVSLNNSGREVSANTTPPAISADGRFVAFGWFGSGQVPEDTNGQTDVYVHDRVAHTIERVSVDSAEAQTVDGGSFVPELSGDGRFVVFASDATNLVADDTNGVRDVFVRDRTAGTTERVNVASDGTQADGPSVGPGVRGGIIFGPDISDDGRVVTFDSIATNLVAGDTNTCQAPALAPFSVPGTCPDIFVRDRGLALTHRVSIGSGGEQANHASTDPAFSGDGRVTGFFSLASNLVAGDTNTCQAGIAIFDDPGECPDIFVHEVGGTRAEADIAVDISAAPSPAVIGRELRYTTVVTNHGPAAATRVRLAQTLPQTALLLSFTATQGSCATVEGTLRCALGALETGASATVTITLRPIRVEPLTSTATATARQFDPDGTNNVETEVTPVEKH